MCREEQKWRFFRSCDKKYGFSSFVYLMWCTGKMQDETSLPNFLTCECLLFIKFCWVILWVEDLEYPFTRFYKKLPISGRIKNNHETIP